MHLIPERTKCVEHTPGRVARYLENGARTVNFVNTAAVPEGASCSVVVIAVEGGSRGGRESRSTDELITGLSTSTRSALFEKSRQFDLAVWFDAEFERRVRICHIA